MKKTIKTTLLVGSLISILSTSVLFAEESPEQQIDKKAIAIVHDAKIKADKLISDAKVKAKILIEKAETDALELKKESLESLKETTVETKELAKEAIQKAKTKSHELVEKTKSMPQVIKQGIEDKYIYTKEVANNSYKKSKDVVNDTIILATIKYAFIISPEIHSMKIDVDVRNGVVELFGKVRNNLEAQEAIQIAISAKGVLSVKSFFVIEH